MISGCPKVLIADDDENIRRVITTLVKRALPSARVAVLENGRLGLDHYRRHGADLIISNFMMPEMNGPSFVAKVREVNPHIPIIMVSGSPEAAQLGMDAGIDRFVDKMDLIRRLPAEIHELMSHAVA